MCNYKTKKDSKDSAASLVHLAVKNLEEAIEKNHGIKTSNIENLYKPIGYTIDNTLITALHNFGKNRGDIAHTSFKTQQLLDPVTEKSNIKNIGLGLKKFDEDFYKLISSGSVPLSGAKSLKSLLNLIILEIKAYSKNTILFGV